MTQPDDKHLFLVCYDYGMGGLWGVMMAHSEEDITRKYPELDVVKDHPKRMTDEHYNQICENELHDVDEEPRGFLVALIADRGRRQQQE